MRQENYDTIIQTLREQSAIEGGMTLRRCWYVLLSKGLVREHPNPQSQSQKNAPYQRLSQLLLKARVNHDLAWEVIVDRTRRIDKPITWNTVDEAVGYVLDRFNYDPSQQQERYVEVWVEKDAVSNRVYEATAPFFVPLVTARGFSSGTYMHDAAERFNQIYEKPITILYLSDYDPEGEYFPKLFKEQMAEKYECVAEIEVEKLALTKPQIIAWQLPRIPLTMKKVHAQKLYVLSYLVDNQEHRDGRWKVELDAVDNVTLARLISNRLKQLVDIGIINKMRRKAKRHATEWRKQHRFGKKKRG